MSEDDFELVEGSGNVFRDFGDPLADLKQAKAVLAARIIATLDDRGLTVRKAAERTGFAAADFSRVRNADLGRFTLDRLMKMLAALDRRLHVAVQIGERAAEEPPQVRYSKV
ncbi:MAG: helix-turn-helix transcriptional regulator [Rhodospirillaceae bacterium]|nr:helix-turn-helix transcriptional regulator [Rhodospirillaceae bacterium]